MSETVKRRNHPLAFIVALLGLFMVIGAACSDDSDDSADGEDGNSEESENSDALKVAIVGNPQMEDIESLTPELFTEDTGIEVEFTVLEEQNLREVVTRDVSAEGGQFDVVMIGMYEAPQFGADGLLADLSEFTADDADYNVDDILEPVRAGLSVGDSLYAAPFYAESSFLMYRQDLLDAAGQEMPANPTWDEVAAIARAVDSDDTAGICLRGKPGWGDLGASFTTVLNTFGGTWWAANEDGSIGEAQVDQPEFEEALTFYTDLIADAGQDDAATASFNECLSLYQNDEVAMWYDATVAASILEADDSPVKGKNGFALAPVNLTEGSGWLWAWSLAIPEANENKEDAWEFISWATGPEYLSQAAEALDGGWASVPPGTRQSLYDTPEYVEAASAFADITLEAMNAADPQDPGTTPRPGVGGVQFVGVPEFQDVGTACTEEFATVIAGNAEIADALANCQEIASEATAS